MMLGVAGKIILFPMMRAYRLTTQNGENRTYRDHFWLSQSGFPEGEISEFVSLCLVEVLKF